MKKIIIIAMVLLSGCASPKKGFVIKNLDGWDRANGFDSACDLLVGPDGSLFTAVATNQPVSRWQIHPDAPLDRVATYTQWFKGNQRIEIWTAQGIFIVGGPLYGGRRVPWFGKTDVAYRVTGGAIERNSMPWTSARSPQDAGGKIFADLARQADLCFVNLYFDFSPSSSWSDVERVLDAFLPRVDDMRGLWLGRGDNDAITLHLHDIRNKEWKTDRTSPSSVRAGAARR